MSKEHLAMDGTIVEMYLSSRIGLKLRVAAPPTGERRSSGYSRLGRAASGLEGK